MATSSYVGAVSSSRILFLFSVLLLETIQQTHYVESLPLDFKSKTESDQKWTAENWTTLIIPIAVFVTLISFVFLCSGGCLQWFGRRRVEVPMGFANPIAEGSMMVPISQIDVRALELDPVIFEPLPTLHDLTPSNRYVGESNGHFDSQAHASSVVPFSADDSSIYAHDWFDEPYRNFPRGNIEYVKEVGKGWFGQVIEAEARDIVPFARKIRVLVKVLREDASGVEQMKFLDESRWYRDANHGNILKLLGHSIEMLPFLLIMEHCPQGDLKSYLIANVTRAEMLNSQGAIVRMALDIAKGLEWMAFADFIHSDLAARNCQVGSEGRIIIGDYGLATQTFRDDYYWSSNIAIPLRWTAPETLHCTINTIQTLKVTAMSNVWTFGVVLWEICEFGKLPYFELSDDEVISRVIADRNYTLGQPTMPCLAVKEKLHGVMASCWNLVPEKRPSIASIVEKLEIIFNEMQFSETRDEFDSKWEQLGKSTVDKEKGKKKNVSFMGLQEEIPLTIRHSTNLSSMEKVENSENIQLGQSYSNSKEADKVEPSSESCQLSDPDEEHWRKRIERGDISQKVREKSQSVQDLMVLTHVEPSDLSDPESLVVICKSSVFQSAMPHGVNNLNGSSLRKSSSETALNCLSNSNSSQSVIPLATISSCNNAAINSNLNSLITPDSVIPSTPNKIPNLEVIKIEFPDKVENVEVKNNVIQSTPSPKPAASIQNFNSLPAATTLVVSKLPLVNRQLKLLYNDEVAPNSEGHRRHTSTPIRTPSPMLDSAGENDDSSENDVFEATKQIDSTWTVSPISQHYMDATRFTEIEGYSSILMGASDDLGLQPYQRVTTELEQPLAEFDHETLETEEVASFRSKVHSSGPLKANFALGKFNEFMNSEETDPGITRLNGNGVDSAMKEDTIESIQNSKNDFVLNSRQKRTARISFPTDDEIADSEKNGAISSNSKSLWSQHSNFEPVNTGGSSGEIADESSAAKSSVPDTATENVGLESNVISSSIQLSEDEDDFWTKQMQSLQEAAGDTRALFQLGLGEEELKQSKDKFVEDIEAATEELGSLVMHDLEEENSKGEVVKETREEIEPGPSRRAKLAFDGATDTVDNYPQDWEAESDTEITSWELTSSIEVKKTKETTNGPKVPRRIVENDVESEIEDDNEDIYTDFIPSKWNQNLTPSKPAIKSPEQQPLQKSSLRKSVSFERKKPQLVYEYPPPPPGSDSDEDDKVSLASALPSSLSSSLDWELTQEEMEDAEINQEDWEDEVITKAENPMDMYRISGFGDESFQIRGSNEPFVFQPSTLGELRHTRDRLKLDLSRGEASILDEETKGAKLDSGVGSSTNVSPFNHCDNQA